MTWKTRTRNKILVAGLAFIALAASTVIYGWLVLERPEAPAMLAALVGSGGLWAVINAAVIGWENTKKKE